MHHASIPESHREFFDAVVAAFRKFPEVPKQYAIANHAKTHELMAKLGPGKALLRRRDADRYVTEIVDADTAANVDGCCEYCVDDDGNTYCCISGPDC